MNRLLLCSLLASAAFGQDIYQRGSAVFRKSCAQGYCHGSAGAQGRAPRLTGQNYAEANVTKIVSDGVPNTGMPAFRNILPAAELNAVIAYVVKISGGNYVGLAQSASAKEMPSDAKRGKALFFDPDRGIKRCGTCHLVDGMGIAVGPNLATGAGAATDVTVAAIRRGSPAAVRKAQMGGQSFPALVVEQGKDFMRIYDLSALPPVLLSVTKGDVQLSGGSSWKHGDAVKNYTDQELSAINAYLRWLATQ